MLNIQHISKRFGGVAAVHDLSLVVEPGKVTSLVGPNGAGKTTVLNILTGLVTPDSGGIFYQDKPIGGLPHWKISQLGIIRTFQELRLCRRITVLENVLLGLQHQRGEGFLNAVIQLSPNSTQRRNGVERAVALLEQCALAGKEDELAEALSYGEQKLLTICCCLAADPMVLLLDEPVAGVQPATIERMATILRDVVRSGRRGLVLVEHDMEFVASVSDTVVVLDQGVIVATGKPNELVGNATVMKTYLS